MLFCFAIWKEIISHLRYSGDNNNTLCALAVTSRSISNIALDSLWRNGAPIWAIVNVINSFAQDQLILENLEDEEEIGFWWDQSPVSVQKIVGWVSFF